jgi:hypothetical protein
MIQWAPVFWVSFASAPQAESGAGSFGSLGDLLKGKLDPVNKKKPSGKNR